MSKQDALRKLAAYIEGRASSSSRALEAFNASPEQKEAVSMLSKAVSRSGGRWERTSPLTPPPGFLPV